MGDKDTEHLNINEQKHTVHTYDKTLINSTHCECKKVIKTFDMNMNLYQH